MQILEKKSYVNYIRIFRPPPDLEFLCNYIRKKRFGGGGLCFPTGILLSRHGGSAGPGQFDDAEAVLFANISR